MPRTLRGKSCGQFRDRVDEPGPAVQSAVHTAPDHLPVLSVRVRADLALEKISSEDRCGDGRIQSEVGIRDDVAPDELSVAHVVRAPGDLHEATAAKERAVAWLRVAEILPAFVQIREIRRTAAILARREAYVLDRNRRDDADGAERRINHAGVERRLRQRPVRANVLDRTERPEGL